MNVPLIPSQAVSQKGGSASEAVPTLWVRVAGNSIARARGLIARPMPAPACGLLLENTAAVHGFGMRYPLDLIFLDGQGMILQCRHLKPARAAVCRGAYAVLEMRSGEVGRLGLRPGMKPALVRVEQIFETPPIPDPLPRRRSTLARALILIGAMLHSSMHGAPPSQGGSDQRALVAATVWPGPLPRPLSLASPLAPQTLQHLEDEAEALYREAPDERRDIELVRLYETLAELGPHRSPLAWLRIGNIHQRSGRSGPAMEAYRRASVPPLKGADADQLHHDQRSPANPEALLDTSQRKALLNLAALALEQARQSLDRLAARTGADGSVAARTLDREIDAKEQTGAAAGASYRRHLDSLAQSLAQQEMRQEQQRRQRPQPQPQPQLQPQPQPQSAEDPASIDEDQLAPRRTPYMVERYTASGRRNAVKAARGSLNTHPADEQPAPPILKPRSRPAGELLPSVEYLRGDPQRAAAADAKTTSKRGRAESGGAAVRRGEP